MEKTIKQETKEIKFVNAYNLEEKEIKGFEKHKVVITCRIKKQDDGTEVPSNVVAQLNLSNSVNLEAREVFNVRNNKFKPDFISAKEFSYLRLLFNKNSSVNKLTLNVPIRFVKGLNVESKEYYFLELFLAPNLIKRIYLSRIDLKMLEMEKVKINWVVSDNSESEEAISVDEALNAY